jgi:hypothetical protein
MKNESQRSALDISQSQHCNCCKTPDGCVLVVELLSVWFSFYLPKFFAILGAKDDGGHVLGLQATTLSLMESLLQRKPDGLVPSQVASQRSFLLRIIKQCLPNVCSILTTSAASSSLEINRLVSPTITNEHHTNHARNRLVPSCVDPQRSFLLHIVKHCLLNGCSILTMGAACNSLEKTHLQ